MRRLYRCFCDFVSYFLQRNYKINPKLKLLIVGNHKINVTLLNWLTIQSRIVYNFKKQYGLDSEAVYVKITQIVICLYQACVIK